MNLESTKRPGRPRSKNPSKKPRRKEPEEISWMAEPAIPAPKPDLEIGVEGGFKHIKHKWLIKYKYEKMKEEQEAAAAAAEGNVAEALPEEDREGLRPVESPKAGEGRKQDAGELDEQEPRGEPVGRGNPGKGGEQTDRDTEEVVNGPGAHKKALSPDKDAKGAGPYLPRKAPNQEAGKRRRGGHGASGVHRDLCRRDGPLTEHVAQQSRRSSEHAADTSAAMQQQAPALSQSDRCPSSPGVMEATQLSPRGALDQGWEGELRGTLLREAAKDGDQPSLDRRRGRPAVTPLAHEELVAETKGDVAVDMVAAYADGTDHRLGGMDDRHVIAAGFMALAPPPLVQVSYLDGDEKEQLGELDINQLDSFRDLWLTIRSAYSARLPKEDLKLIYCDVDNDLMLYQDEPWEHFKAVARSLFLTRKKRG